MLLEISYSYFQGTSFGFIAQMFLFIFLCHSVSASIFYYLFMISFLILFFLGFSLFFSLNFLSRINLFHFFPSFLIGSKFVRLQAPSKLHFLVIELTHFCLLFKVNVQIPNLWIWLFPLPELYTLKNFKLTENWKEEHGQYPYIIHADLPVVHLLS